MSESVRRIASIGFGAMARSLGESLRAGNEGLAIGAALVPAGDVPDDLADCRVAPMTTVEALLEWKPDLVVECASHQAVQEFVPAILENGIDVVVVSIGSLADVDLLQRLDDAANKGKSRLTVASGAIGGLDVLRSAKIAGLEQVVYTGSKPPAAWKGTPADEKFDLAALSGPTVIFKGTAEQAAREYPKNANVTAAVALAGIGFAQTTVTLVADPGSTSNIHKVEAAGNFGRFSITLENRPLPANPKTSWLAALSIEQCVTRHFKNIEL